jgi:hypothetical protein
MIGIFSESRESGGEWATVLEVHRPCMAVYHDCPLLAGLVNANLPLTISFLGFDRLYDE